MYSYPNGDGPFGDFFSPSPFCLVPFSPFSSNCPLQCRAVMIAHRFVTAAGGTLSSPVHQTRLLVSDTLIQGPSFFIGAAVALLRATGSRNCPWSMAFSRRPRVYMVETCMSRSLVRCWESWDKAPRLPPSRFGITGRREQTSGFVSTHPSSKPPGWRPRRLG